MVPDFVRFAVILKDVVTPIKGCLMFQEQNRFRVVVEPESLLDMLLISQPGRT